MSVGNVVGAIIGSFFGPAGAVIGWTIGGVVDPLPLPDQVGPRLTDLHPTSSEYGRPIPIVYGTVGIGGNVIWASDLVEVRNEREEGGGLFGGGTTIVTYTYFANFAVALAEGPNTVGRIWAGPEKRLIWDGINLEGGDGGAQLRIYSGGEDQLPDPLIESYMGVGNAPAYRGTCYVVFENFPLANDFNRIPSIMAEVGATGEAVLNNRTVTYLGESAPPDVPYNDPVALVEPFTGNIWSATPRFVDSVIEVRVNSDATKTQVASFSIPFAGSFSGSVLIAVPGVPNEVWLVGENFGVWKDVFIVFNADTLTYTGTFYSAAGHGTADINEGAYNPVQHKVLFIRYGGNCCYYDPLTRTSPNVFAFNLGDGFGNLGTIWITKILITQHYYAVFYYGSYDGVILRRLDDDAFIAQFAVGGPNSHQFYDPDRDRIIVADDAAAMPAGYHIIDCATLTVTSHTYTYGAVCDTDPVPSYVIQSAVYYRNKYIFGASSSNTVPSTKGTTLYIVNADTLASEYTFTYEAYDPAMPYNMKDPLLAPATNDKNYVFSFDNNHVKRLPFMADGTAVPHPVRLSEVVADLSLRAGLAAPQINVTALENDWVDGYVLARQMAVRAAVDALRPAYYFDAVESDGVVRFVKRGGAMVAVIDAQDLGAHMAGEQPVDPLLVTRQMDNEIPRRLDVNYLLAATNYATATKGSKRLIGASGDTNTLELALVLTDTKAQEVADVNLLVAWVQRVSFQFTLPRKYAFLEPTDPVAIAGHSMRITKITATPGGLLQCEAVADDAAHYTPHVVVTETLPNDQAVYIAGPTRLELM